MAPLFWWSQCSHGIASGCQVRGVRLERTETHAVGKGAGRRHNGEHDWRGLTRALRWYVALGDSICYVLRCSEALGGSVVRVLRVWEALGGSDV